MSWGNQTCYLPCAIYNLQEVTQPLPPPKTKPMLCHPRCGANEVLFVAMEGAGVELQTLVLLISPGWVELQQKTQLLSWDCPS